MKVKVKVRIARLKQLALNLLELILSSFISVHCDDKDDWWRYYGQF